MSVAAFTIASKMQAIKVSHGAESVAFAAALTAQLRSTFAGQPQLEPRHDAVDEQLSTAAQRRRDVAANPVERSW